MIETLCFKWSPIVPDHVFFGSRGYWKTQYFEGFSTVPGQVSLAAGNIAKRNVLISFQLCPAKFFWQQDMLVFD